MVPTDIEKNNFANTITELVEQKEISHMEAVLWYCNETGLELEVAATLLSANLKAKIETNARDLHMVKK